MNQIDEKLYDKGLCGPLKPSLGPLRQRFGAPPFSCLDQTHANWQTRKKRWIGLGIESEVGRGDNLLALAHLGQGTSVFDPVLCELAYAWWSPNRGVVLDPFAGGSVRGCIASILGRKYWGCELRGEQVEANQKQGEKIRGKFKPKWFQGDSEAIIPEKAPKADFIFSCPPYGDLEEYSDEEADLSNKSWQEFRAKYQRIIYHAAAKLKENRFACFVVSNYRDKREGKMRNLVAETCECFEAAGCDFYNDGILLGSSGSAARRANRIFVNGNRKLVKIHQNVLCFCKGSPKLAAEAILESEKE